MVDRDNGVGLGQGGRRDPASSRQASSPASEVILAPWNSSLSRLSNLSFSASWPFSPIGFLQPAPCREAKHRGF